MCYLCTKFARIIHYMSRGRLDCIGHYTENGNKIQVILGDSSRDMFWFIKNNKAFGGRSAILPLIKFLFDIRSPGISSSFNDNNPSGCKTIKSVFLRSSSIIIKGKKITLRNGLP